MQADPPQRRQPHHWWLAEEKLPRTAPADIRDELCNWLP